MRKFNLFVGGWCACAALNSFIIGHWGIGILIGCLSIGNVLLGVRDR